MSLSKKLTASKGTLLHTLLPAAPSALSDVSRNGVAGPCPCPSSSSMVNPTWIFSWWQRGFVTSLLVIDDLGPEIWKLSERSRVFWTVQSDVLWLRPAL